METMKKSYDIVKEMQLIHAEEEERQRKNPLAGYSTLQLQRELNRRRRQNIHF